MYLPKSKQINTAMCRGGSGMELHELNPGDDIWFKYPKAKTSFPAVVEELNYNFNGEPYLKVRVGSELVKIDDRYDIVKV